MILSVSQQMNNCYSHLQIFNNICPCSLHTEYQLMHQNPGVQRWVQWFSNTLKSDTCCCLSFTSTTHSSGLAAFFSKGLWANKPQEDCRADPLPRMELCLKPWESLLKRTAYKYRKVWKWRMDQFLSFLFVYAHPKLQRKCFFSLNFLETEEFCQRWVCTI